MKLFISAVTQKIHASRTCSMTRRNLAYNLETSATELELRALGYSFCKKCFGTV